VGAALDDGGSGLVAGGFDGEDEAAGHGFSLASQRDGESASQLLDFWGES
jgi:hypothetical protein